jgi:hypothetical protein
MDHILIVSNTKIQSKSLIGRGIWDGGAISTLRTGYAECPTTVLSEQTGGVFSRLQ